MEQEEEAIKTIVKIMLDWVNWWKKSKGLLAAKSIVLQSRVGINALEVIMSM